MDRRARCFGARRDRSRARNRGASGRGGARRMNWSSRAVGAGRTRSRARSASDAVRDADQRLTSVSASLEFLLLVTPSNLREAWTRFQAERFERAPLFNYRPPAVDPRVSKRVLDDVDLEQIEDPTLALIFGEKRRELDELITMLLERNTPRFVQGSLRVFG